MTIVRTRRTIDNAGAGRGHRRRRAPRERERLPGGDRGRRPVRRADRDASHRGRPGRELAGGRGQGAHRCDLHPPEPRDGGAGDRRTARGPRLARRLVPHRRHPAEGRRRGRWARWARAARRHVRTTTARVKRWKDTKMVRRWVGAGMLEAERTFRRIKGCKDMPTLVAAVRTEVARRVAADAGEPVTAPQYDQAA